MKKDFQCLIACSFRDHTSKVLITIYHFNTIGFGHVFISDLLFVILNAHYFKRGTYDLKKVSNMQKSKNFIFIIAVRTNSRELDALLIMTLPVGPIGHFKLSKLFLWKDIKVCWTFIVFSESCLSY
ncbi:unnamed protein product [Coffea canephora]|uniref:Uncharacterized protein n=1 Tax=Coffea canephora TaxID=49390 RepID=A0A068UJL3_COFCA|nr:unnamed protein product [Coffea canephora]